MLGAPTDTFRLLLPSLYYIFMLEDYYERTGMWRPFGCTGGWIDPDYYDSQIGSRDWWSIWITGPLWTGRRWGVSGVKPEVHGPSTIINLMYAYALLDGAKIQEAVAAAALPGSIGTDSEICGRVQTLCWDAERQMYREGPDFPRSPARPELGGVKTAWYRGRRQRC